MAYSEESLRKIDATVRDWQRYGRQLVALLAPQRSQRTPRILVRNAIVRTTITARSGRQKGKGTVDILCDKDDGTGIDAIHEKGVTCWNPTLTTVNPSQTSGVDRQVITITIDGLTQLMGGDCPV